MDPNEAIEIVYEKKIIIIKKEDKITRDGRDWRRVSR